MPQRITVIVDRMGVVHDLGTLLPCPAMSRLGRELSEGRGCYVTVKGAQIRAYELPGCNDCFGDEKTYRRYIQTI